MKIYFDFHTHTMASGHAYSTLTENIECARKQGLTAYGFSDHSEKLPGAPNNLYFTNFKVLPKEINGVQLYAGVEINIMDYDGTIDVCDRILSKVHYAIASLHPPCIEFGTKEQNTNAIIKAMQNEKIKIIGHPDDSRYPLDYDIVVSEAAKTNTILEVNCSSLKPNALREGAVDNVKLMLAKCVEYNAKVILGTDSHYCGDVGDFTYALNIIKEVDFPKELIVNAWEDGLKYVLNI